MLRGGNAHTNTHARTYAHTHTHTRTNACTHTRTHSHAHACGIVAARRECHFWCVARHCHPRGDAHRRGVLGRWRWHFDGSEQHERGAGGDARLGQGPLGNHLVVKHLRSCVPNEGRGGGEATGMEMRLVLYRSSSMQLNSSTHARIGRGDFNREVPSALCLPPWLCKSN